MVVLRINGDDIWSLATRQNTDVIHLNNHLACCDWVMRQFSSARLDRTKSGKIIEWHHARIYTSTVWCGYAHLDFISAELQLTGVRSGHVLLHTIERMVSQQCIQQINNLFLHSI